MVAKTCKNLVLPESGHGLPQGNWPCVVCPLAKPSCIASQKGVGSVTAAAHSLMIAETTGIRTIVASLPCLWQLSRLWWWPTVWHILLWDLKLLL